MNLLLEGPDNAGKTTLARYVQGNTRVAVEYFHPGGPPKDVGEEHLCISSQFNLLKDQDWVILDRATCISQQVYKPDLQLDSVRQAALKELLGLKRLLIVYCRPSTDRLMRKEDFTWRDNESEEHKQLILNNQHIFIQRYDELMAGIPHILYDFDDRMAGSLKTLLVGAMGEGPNCYELLTNLLQSGDLKS